MRLLLSNLSIRHTGLTRDILGQLGGSVGSQVSPRVIAAALQLITVVILARLGGISELGVRRICRYRHRRRRSLGIRHRYSMPTHCRRWQVRTDAFLLFCWNDQLPCHLRNTTLRVTSLFRWHYCPGDSCRRCIGIRASRWHCSEYSVRSIRSAQGRDFTGCAKGHTSLYCNTFTRLGIR